MRRRLMSKQGGVKATLIQQLDTQAGDVVFASPNSEEKRFYRLGDGNDVIPSEYVPIGVVVIPASHNVYGDFACGVMSLMLMDGGSPETGSIEGNLLYEWSADSQQVFNYFCYVGRNGSFTKNVKGVKDVLSGNNIQLPSDLFTKLQNTYDSKTFYDDTSYSYYAPSPYNNDGSRNEAYYQISSPSSSGNALSDFDGIGNTKKLIEGVDNTMFASVSCSKYFTVGTKSGDWYLPAIGEFGYFVARFKAISSAIQELRKIYGDNIASYLICESEMEYWTSTKFTDGLYTFFVDSGSPTTWGDYYEWYSCAIAFTKLGALERNYGDILISGGNTTDIPASGGSSQVTGYTYSQTYGYGDSTTNGGTITSGAEISVTSVSGDDLVDNETERVKKGDSVLTVTMNGKTVTKSYPVYQEANVATYGDIVVKNSGSASVIPASGGSSTASGVVCEQTVSYTSNYSKKANISYGNYTTVSVDSLGATEKAKSVVGNSVVVVTGGGGKQIEVKVPVYQQENKADVRYEITAYGTPTVSIGSGITCKGGSATVSHSVTNTRTYYYTSNTAGKKESETGTTTIKITSNGNSRFSLSGNTLSHSNMTTNAVTDSCTITATNSGDTSKTKTATVSVTNNADATSAITAYGTPTVSIGSGITCAGGSATITSSVSNTRTYYYCSGSAGRTASESGSVNLTISHQSFSTSTSKGTNGNISRFSLSGTKLSHSSMTTNAGYDHVTITATNASSTSKSASASTYVKNAETSSKITAYGTPSVSIGSGITCSGGSATVSHSVTNTRTYYYCSGSTSRNVSEAGTTTIKITSNGNGRFSLSGNKLSHSTMGKSEVTDSCTITATNSGDTSKTKTATVSVTNTSSTTYSTPTAGTITNGYIAASGGSASATAGKGSQTWTKTYCSGQKDTGTITVSPSVASISGSASSKGETSSGQTTVKKQTVTWSANGKSTSGTMYVYQRANSFSGCSVTCSISSSSVSRLGGSITVSGNATVTWSSGSYTKTPSRQISDQNAGASISGSTITFGKNTSKSARYAYARNYISYNGSTYYSDAKKINQNGKVADLKITASHGSTVTYSANYAPDVSISCNGSFGMKSWDGKTTYYWTSYATISSGSKSATARPSSGNGGTNVNDGTYTGWTVLNCSPTQTEKYDITITGV